MREELIRTTILATTTIILALGAQDSFAQRIQQNYPDLENIDKDTKVEKENVITKTSRKLH